jgi:hypothetical protein
MKNDDERTDQQVVALTEELRSQFEPELNAMQVFAYDQGVADAREQFKNPKHAMGFRLRKTAASTDLSPATKPKTPYELAARAREIQGEAEKRGEGQIGTTEAVRRAYSEAGEKF